MPHTPGCIQLLYSRRGDTPKALSYLLFGSLMVRSVVAPVGFQEVTGSLFPQEKLIWYHMGTFFVGSGRQDAAKHPAAYRASDRQQG